MGLKDADGMANNVDPDQTASSSGFVLYGHAYLSQNLGFYGKIYLNCFS